MVKAMRKRRWLPALGLLGLFGAAVAAFAPSAVKREPDVIYVPTPQPVVETMLETARVTKNDMVYDLGCGDGRIVITAAKKYGARGIGVDIDPERIRESNANARTAGVTDRVKFVQTDLFTMNFKDATVVTLYLLPQLNVRLRPRLLDELRPGTRIVSHSFDMDEWEPDRTLTPEGRSVYYWVIPAKVAGAWRWSQPGRTGGGSSTLQLTQNFQKVSGTLRMGNQTLKVTEGKLNGDQISLTVAGNNPGTRTTMRLTGRVRGDSITGTITSTGGTAATKRDWTATRARS